MNFYFNKSFYIRAGYGLHKIDQKLATNVSAASEAGAEQAYGIVENKLSEGMILGGGVVLYNGTSTDLFTQVEKCNYSTINSGAWNISLGFRYYLK